MDKIVVIFKVSSILLLFDNRIYESSPINADFVDLRFDGDKRLICCMARI